MNPTTATFQLVEYSFPEFTFKAVSHTESDKTVIPSVSFAARGIYSPDSRRFKVIVDMKISTDNEANLLQILCEATFEFGRELDSIPDYFYSNSIAIIYPYVRAFCSLITTQSNNVGIILPVLNLTTLGEKLRQNTTLQDNDTENHIVSGSSL